MNLKGNRMGSRWLISLGPGFTLVGGCCEYSNEPSVVIKYVDFLAWLVGMGF